MNEQQPSKLGLVQEAEAMENALRQTTDFDNLMNKPSALTDINLFRELEAIADTLQRAKNIPETYQGKKADIIIALDMAQRLNLNVLMVMQNLNVIYGRPAWSGQFIIAMVNASGRFPDKLDFRFKYEDTPRTIDGGYWKNKQFIKKTEKLTNISCIAVAKDKNGVDKKGAPVSLELAINEGWYHKPGSKWQSMPEQMLIYRAASFFGKVYCPDLLLGLPDVEEVRDTEQKPVPQWVGVDMGSEPDETRTESLTRTLSDAPLDKENESPTLTKPVFSYAELAEKINKCALIDELDEAVAVITDSDLPTKQVNELMTMVFNKKTLLEL